MAPDGIVIFENPNDDRVPGEGRGKRGEAPFNRNSIKHWAQAKFDSSKNIACPISQIECLYLNEIMQNQSPHFEYYSLVSQIHMPDE